MEKRFNHNKPKQNFAVIIVEVLIEESLDLITLPKFVLVVEVNILQINTAKQNSAQFVEIKHIEKIGKADVYNMEVKNHHNFSVCGGFIVHNCMDSTRYFCSTIIGNRLAKLKEVRM